MRPRPTRTDEGLVAAPSELTVRRWCAHTDLSLPSCEGARLWIGSACSKCPELGPGGGAEGHDCRQETQDDKMDQGRTQTGPFVRLPKARKRTLWKSDRHQHMSSRVRSKRGHSIRLGATPLVHGPPMAPPASMKAISVSNGRPPSS